MNISETSKISPQKNENWESPGTGWLSVTQCSSIYWHTEYAE